MSMRWSNRARSLPEISVQRKPRRIHTMEEMKKMSLEVFLRKSELDRAETGELEIGWDEQIWCDSWCRSGGKVFHKAGAEW